MIFANVSLKQWLQRYPGLEPQDVICDCGKKGKTTLPIISNEWAGLAMPACSRCGHDIPGFVVKARSAPLQQELNKLLDV